MRTLEEKKLINEAIHNDRLVDITTTGRKTGKKYRKEVRLRHVEGTVYLTNNPGPRDWAANLYTIPNFLYHFKESAEIEVMAVAVPIKEDEQKRKILTILLSKEDALDQLEARVAGSNLFRIDFPGQ